MKKLKVFNHPWHLSHQFSLNKFDWIDWDWLIQCHRQYNDIPRGDFFKGEYVVDYKPNTYDFALLHLDQQCFAEDLWQRGKGQLYRELNKTITDIPKVVIMHGTPWYPEMFENQEDLINKAKEAIGDNYVIFNSKTAKKQWGFDDNPKAIAIWHGLDAKEWNPDLPKEPRVVTMIGPAGLDYYYDRDFLRAIKEGLLDEGIHHCHITVDYNAKNFQEYQEFLGRSLLYLNPTKESPMPRSRTEAMLSGCCVLTTPHQDAGEYIKNGVNGYIIKRNPQEVIDLIKHCFENYKKTIEIGLNGRKTAEEIFSFERFEKDWKDFIFNQVIK